MTDLPEWEPLTKRNEEYVPYVGHTHPKKIVASAVLQNKRLWVGKRHFELIAQVKKDGGEYVTQDQQGFLTDDGRFIMRTAAYTLALRHGQVKEENLINKNILTSEDLWK